MHFELTVRQHYPMQPEEQYFTILRLDPVQPGETWEQTSDEMRKFLEQAIAQIQKAMKIPNVMEKLVPSQNHTPILPVEKNKEQP